MQIKRTGYPTCPFLFGWKFCDSQQILHRLVYLAVLKAVEVDLGDSLRAVAEGFADDCCAYSGTFEDCGA